jgi:hypothetical protein
MHGVLFGEEQQTVEGEAGGVNRIEVHYMRV